MKTRSFPRLLVLATVLVVVGVVIRLGVEVIEAFPDVAMTVEFTSSPVQVRFWDVEDNTYGEWENFPFPGGDDCQVGDAAPRAQIRTSPGLVGVRLAVNTNNMAGQGGKLKATVDEGVIIIEGTGQITVGLSAYEYYSCDLVLTRK